MGDSRRRSAVACGLRPAGVFATAVDIVHRERRREGSEFHRIVSPDFDRRCPGGEPSFEPLDERQCGMDLRSRSLTGVIQEMLCFRNSYR